MVIGKIQGNGRKFLDLFKVILGHKYHYNHQMRSLSTDYSQNPQQKVSFIIIIFLSLIVSSRRHGIQMANEADEVLLDKRSR